MKPGIVGLLWDEDAKVITLLFVAFVAGSLALLGSGLFTNGLPTLLLLTVLICLAGGRSGLISSKKFGGRRNFTGRLILLLSASLLSLALGTFFGTLDTEPNLFVQNSIEGRLLGVFFVLGIVIAAYALVTGAGAVANGLDRTTVTRIALALAVLLVIGSFGIVAEMRLTPGITTLSAVETDLPWDASFFALVVGALILVAQLGKWYATPGIRIVAYGYVFLGVVPGLVRTLVLLSGLAYAIQALLFLGTLTAVLYVIALGLNRVRPSPVELKPPGTK